MKSLAAALTLTLIGCASPVPPVAVVIPPPAETARVSPAVAIARQEASKAGAVAARLENQIGVLQISAAGMEQGMHEALAEAARLKTAKTATEAELEGLWAILTKETERSKAMFAAVEQANTTALEHREARLIAEKRIDELVKVAADKDTEAAALRVENTSLRAAMESAAAYRARQDKKIASLMGDAVLGKQLKITFIVGAACLGLGLSLWLALKFLKPS